MDNSNTDDVSTMQFDRDGDARDDHDDTGPCAGLREAYYERLRQLNEEDAKYVIQQKVAEGGMGAIYKVYDKGLRRTLVLKVILPGVVDDPLLFQRFVEEAQITGRLEHPNIIPVHNIGVLGGNKLFFSMKYMHGDSLSQILKQVREGVSDYTQFGLLTIFRKVCDAAAFAHSRGIIHRDIKPENIMVGDYGEVLLMDWGLARVLDGDETQDAVGIDDDAAFDPVKTRYGVVKGTPAYMSPEQAKGSVDNIDARSDIFLLGATLYSLATFQAPYTGDDVYEILANAENGNFIDPSLRAPEQQLPVELVRIIQRAMAYSPDERYQTVEELSADIDALLEGNTTSITKTFSRGDVIIHEGDPGDEAYVILSGQVEVYKTVRGKSVTLITLGEGDVMGEMALISKAPRSASIRAVEATEVVVITEEVMQQGLDKLPPWMGKVVDCMAERLRSANTQIHPLMSGDASFHVLQQLRYLYLCWGIPKLDGYTEMLTVAVNTKQAIQEIAVSLCISKERVAMVVSRLLESNLIKPFGNDSFVIPNMDLFNDFTDYCRAELRIDAGFTTPRQTTVFVSDSEYVVRQTIGDTVDELQAVAPYPVDKVIGVNDPDAVGEKFARILNRMRDVQSAPESSSVVARRTRGSSSTG